MTDYGVAKGQFPITGVNLSAATEFRDPLLDDAGAGVRFLFDLDFSWCYPGGSRAGRAAADDPTSGQVIYDMVERSNGSYLRQGSTPVADYAGGGFDFSSCTHNPFGVKGPTDAWDTIHAATNEYFLWCGYYRMPSSGDWKPSNGNVTFFDNALNNGTYITNVDPLVIFQITPASTAQLVARRQKAIGANSANATILTLEPTSDYYGKMCQLAFWRNADGHGFRMKSADGEISTTAAVGSESSVDFSGLGPVWGRATTPDNGPMGAEDQAASNYRLYRGWLEDLSLSGRDPLTVLNADWTRVQARIAASAAANGGTSIIFV